MGLPWFAFDLDDYTGDTMHLTTEEHGAYLLMMLAYYRTGKPLPASDRSLASLTKLPMDRWLDCKPTLAAFFTDTGTHWHHGRIEAELLAASSKHAKAVAKATAAANARHGKKSSTDAPSTPQAPSQRAPRKKSSPSQPAASIENAPSKPEAKQTDAHLQEHITLSSERVIAREQNDDNPTKAPKGLSKEESFNPLGATLPETWTPNEGDIATAHAYGLDDDTIRAEVLTFHCYNAQNGTFSKNWHATWQMWCARWKDREAAKPKPPKPRVEVNSAPSAKEWDFACSLWAKGSSTWSYKTLGPEPGQPGCRCPNVILTKHNIDPATGRVATPTKEPVS